MSHLPFIQPHVLLSSKGNSGLPTSVADIALEQEKDLKVSDLRQGSLQTSAPPDRISFVVHPGVLYRRVPLGGQVEKCQLVVPQALVPEFLCYIHDNPLGGHLGTLKTLLRVLKVAWWPNVCKDV